MWSASDKDSRVSSSRCNSAADDEGSGLLAERLFDAVCLRGRGAGQQSTETILTSDLAKIVRAFTDTMEDETGVAVDALAAEDACGGGARDAELSRQEFLEAMHKVRGVIGRRAFNAGLRAQLRFALAPSAAPRSRGTSTTGSPAHREGDTPLVLPSLVPAAGPKSAAGPDDSGPAQGPPSRGRSPLPDIHASGSRRHSPERERETGRRAAEGREPDPLPNIGAAGAPQPGGAPDAPPARAAAEPSPTQDLASSPAALPPPSELMERRLSVSSEPWSARQSGEGSGMFGSDGSSLCSSPRSLSPEDQRDLVARNPRRQRPRGNGVRSLEAPGDSEVRVPASRLRRPSLMCDDSWDFSAFRVSGPATTTNDSQLTRPLVGGDGVVPTVEVSKSQPVSPTSSDGSAKDASIMRKKFQRKLVRTTTLETRAPLPFVRNNSDSGVNGSELGSQMHLDPNRIQDAAQLRSWSRTLTIPVQARPDATHADRPAGSRSSRSRANSDAGVSPAPPATVEETIPESPTAASSCPEWCRPQETLIILDWDDTLCPTTFIQGDHRLDWKEEAPCFNSDPDMPLAAPLRGLPRDDTDDEESERGEGEPEAEGVKMADALRRHTESVSAFLRAAVQHGVVVIITLAKPGWVQVSTKNFLPGLEEVLAELKIKVVYARSALARWKMRCAVLDHMDVLQLMKQVAINRSLRKHYDSRPDRSWKNVVCVGDSSTEHEALMEAVFFHLQPRGADPCRCKTVKLPECPTVMQLTSELEVLQRHLPQLCARDGDLHADLSDAGASLAGLEKALSAGSEDADPAPSVDQDAAAPADDPESGPGARGGPGDPLQEAACDEGAA